MKKDLKTTIIGGFLAVIIAVYPIISDGKINWDQVAMAGLIALLGYYAKDKEKPDAQQPPK